PSVSSGTFLPTSTPLQVYIRSRMSNFALGGVTSLQRDPGNTNRYYCMHPLCNILDEPDSEVASGSGTLNFGNEQFDKTLFKDMYGRFEFEVEVYPRCALHPSLIHGKEKDDILQKLNAVVTARNITNNLNVNGRDG